MLYLLQPYLLNILDRQGKMATVSYANFKRPDCTHIPPLCQSNSPTALIHQCRFELLRV